ncbi:MAG TPA: helix-turn-helix transcriptional regulator [Acidimicrobiales bacterium]|nr:helix-turn-helix transcriptional regulator [Acidimicrobiales bacterium]
MLTSGAALVHAARTEAGLSRRTLAAKAGVPISTVSRIEDGQSDPTLTMLDRLLTAAGRRLVIDAPPRDEALTLAEMATAVDDELDRLKIDWTRLRAFVDWIDLHPSALSGAIADPPVRTDTPLDAILAALAEELADRNGIERPRWTRAIGPLDEPWSPPATPRMRAEAEATTPAPFRRRNVILAREALFRSGKG